MYFLGTPQGALFKILMTRMIRMVRTIIINYPLCIVTEKVQKKWIWCHSRNWILLVHPGSRGSFRCSQRQTTLGGKQWAKVVRSERRKPRSGWVLIMRDLGKFAEMVQEIGTHSPTGCQRKTTSFLVVVVVVVIFPFFSDPYCTCYHI